jgi:hypothetical protein
MRGFFLAQMARDARFQMASSRTRVNVVASREEKVSEPTYGQIQGTLDRNMQLIGDGSVATQPMQWRRFGARH